MNVSSLSITNPTPRDWAKLNSFFRYAYHMKGEIWQGGSPVLKNNLGRANYSLEKDHLYIIAIAHQHRKPNYWIDRFEE